MGKKKNKNRAWIIVGVITLLAVTALSLNKVFFKDKTFVLTEKVELRDINETVSANGKVQPETEVKLSAEISGEIVQLPVKEGNKVKKGDLIVKINPDLFVAARNRMEASLNSSKANAANAKARVAQSEAQLLNASANYKRVKQLFDDKAISQADYDNALSQFEVAKADVEAAKESLKAAEYNVKSAEAALKEADDNLRRTTIFAPIDGTVSKLDAEVGERVVGTSQMAGTEIMRIADLTQMEVNIEVNESDIVKVKLGDKADIEIDAYIDRVFEGTVTEIANSSSTLQSGDQVTVFNVKVRIERNSYEDLIDQENPHLSPFRPGMSASVEVKTEEKNQVVAVPIEAVTIRVDSTNKESDEDMKECVFLYLGNEEEGKTELRYVTTGIQDNKYIEIQSGLQAEDVVVSGPYNMVSKTLKNGDEVMQGDRTEVYKFEK
tara:strand:+ start:1034 stop:2344 length:1311 start_codon:yes stop_codon:yes gene_type:complete